MALTKTTTVKTIYTSVLLLLFGCSFLIAQQENQTPSIQEQFQTTIDKASNYQDYKVVKKAQLNELKNNTVKHINTLKDSITSLSNKIEKLNNNIDKLHQQAAQSQENIDNLNSKKDEISFIGIPFSKTTYNILLWSIIGILLLLLGSFIFKYRNANEVTKGAKSNLQLIEDELEAYKRRSLEKEQSLSRQLMDERKKNSGTA